MKKPKIFLFLALFTLAFSWAKDDNANQSTKTCNFFLLKEVDNKIIIEKSTITEGQFQVFKDESLITYVPVFAPGSKSGEIIKKANRINGLITQYANGKIKITVIKKDGSQMQMPDIDLEQALNTDIRINISGSGSYKQAYRIENYETIVDDDGPVLNMFHNKELDKGDFSFVSEMMETINLEKITGEAPYQLFHNWITTQCKLPNGKNGKFVVDLGASNTVMAKSSLPAGAEIAKYEMVAYSEGKKETSKGTPDGATGTIESILGTYHMDSLSLGNFCFTDFSALIIEEFPKAFIDLGIDGIIGRDLLMQTDYLIIQNLNKPDEEKVLIFSANKDKYSDYGHIIPYTLAGGHLFIEGSIEGHKLSYFFDSGATTSSISKSFLDENQISYETTDHDKITAYGLDGKGRKVEIITLQNIQIGDIFKPEMNFDMSGVFALESLGIANSSGQLGMDFLLGYEKVCFDFNSNNIMIWAK